MKVYYLSCKIFLPVTLSEAWEFFSSPKNLAKITPSHMNFRVTRCSGEGSEMYEGQLISYRLNVLPGIETFWMTEITHVQEPYYFVDEQRFGPYKLWNHQHRFREVPGGVEMTDELHYAIPFGWFGRVVNWLFVGQEVQKIFNYRSAVLKKMFSNTMVVNKSA